MRRVVEASTFFDGSRLKIARQLAGLRKSQLAELIEKSPTAVAAWESGAKRPTPTNVAQLALGLSVDPGFFSARPVDLSSSTSLPHFRSLRSTSQLARDQASAYGLLAVDIAAAFERHVEFPDANIPAFPVDLAANGDGAPEAAARALRDSWALESGPLGHLVRLLENHGVLVVFSAPQTSAVDAYSFDCPLRPVVVLNPVKRDYYRQRFDVAHELGHLVMHADAEPGGRTVEEQANRFAAELLMPADEISELLPTSMGRHAWTTFGQLKEQWGVSIQALLYRARHLGRLGDVSYRNAMISLSGKGWRRDEPGLVTVIEQPSLLPHALDVLQGAGISADELIDQSRVPAELFEIVTARTPSEVAVPNTTFDDHGPAPRNVVSLLPRVSARKVSEQQKHHPELEPHSKGAER
ncbi:XRE family transcriptional regulator [Promicromonospora sp. AC04]|uniref:XRE family transcriptional regulator n=1 Tax=Promicromonospora sp. AC04 TaxID=2135723 RepID=UPI000D37DC77|nr:XRE family transcriptional regulator [Promicromonospora sp. AC04]